MSTLVHAALTLRRTARSGYGLLAAAIFLLLLALGLFRGPFERLGVEHAVLGASWLVLFGLRAYARLRLRDGASREGVSVTERERGAKERDRRLADFELGLLLLLGVHGALQVFGGLSSDLYPVCYVVVAFLVSFATKPSGTLLLLVAVAIEGLLWWAAEPTPDPTRYALHAVFTLLFGTLNLLFTRAEIARVRELSRLERDQEREKVKEDARLYRLAGAPSSSAHKDDDKAYRSSIEQVQDALYHVLLLLKRTLELHTCVLLMSDEEGKMHIVELVTDGDEIAEGPFTPGAGAVGAVATRGLVMRLEKLKPGYGGLCYYGAGARVRCFIGVPVYDGGQLRGALCADRLADRPFTPKEEEILKGAVQHLLRAIENERVFVQLDRTKREQSHLYAASQALGEALTEEQVIEAGLSSAAAIAPHDMAAITLFDSESGKHRVLRAVGADHERYKELAFRDNHSLVAMVVKNRHYLPYRGEFDPKQQILFTRRAPLRGMRSLLVLPLIVREDAIGTLVLAAGDKGAFGASIRPTLQVLANQLAVALANAAAVRRLEEMATTDGLTGCLNKRTFLDELDQKLKAAERFGRKLSLLVTDIDHFKSVNDTYGHATGDVVIKGLGEILKKAKRETDSVSRFGGEEFCILCEETDREGAIALAERVREELKGSRFKSEMGELGVTCSIGVATYPDDAQSPSALFEITDQALYAAKRGGRDRVCTSSDTTGATASTS